MEEIIIGVIIVILACSGAIITAAYIVGIPIFISGKITNKYKNIDHAAITIGAITIWNAVSLFVSLLIISSYNLWHYFS